MNTQLFLCLNIFIFHAESFLRHDKKIIDSNRRRTLQRFNVNKDFDDFFPGARYILAITSPMCFSQGPEGPQ